MDLLLSYIKNIKPLIIVVIAFILCIFPDMSFLVEPINTTPWNNIIIFLVQLSYVCLHLVMWSLVVYLLLCIFPYKFNCKFLIHFKLKYSSILAEIIGRVIPYVFLFLSIFDHDLLFNSSTVYYIRKFCYDIYSIHVEIMEKIGYDILFIVNIIMIIYFLIIIGSIIKYIDDNGNNQDKDR